MKNIDKNQKLTDKYLAKVRNKYRITEDTKTKIVVEGVKKRWPSK